MSLLTVQRSPSSETASIDAESEDEEEEDENEDSCHTSASSRSRASSFEGYFASKGAAFALPDGDFTRKAVIGKHGGELQLHLQPMVNLLRDEDTMRLVVKVQSQYPNKIRYMAIVSAFTTDDVEESLVVGIDWSLDGTICSIGLVLPLWRDTSIHLDGDGGFKVSSNGKHHIMKPVSVQTMWTAFQWIHKCSGNATKHNFFPGGSSLLWRKYYEERITSDRISINEWHEMDDVLSKRSDSPTQIVGADAEYELLSKLIKHKLREVMMRVDLEEVTSKQIRTTLEEEMQMDFSARNFKEYIDQEMITIMGQMDSPSMIFDHVYLGSEWNASNLEELQENGVGYILNVTREIDNFFPGTFVYHNVRVWDVEESELLKHWDKTYRFITEAKKNNSKILVHCKMGVSRSASTVIAYGMKEMGWSLHDTMKYVKNKRNCIQPNAGFWKQLVTYEGILNSSKQRYNAIFHRRRSHSDTTEARESAKRRREHKKLHKKYSTLEHARAAVIAEGKDSVDSKPLALLQEAEQEEVEKEEMIELECSETSSSGSDDSIISSSDEEDLWSEIQPDEIKVLKSACGSYNVNVPEVATSAKEMLSDDVFKPAEIKYSDNIRTFTADAALAREEKTVYKKPFLRTLSVPASLSKLPSDNLQRSSSLKDCSTENEEHKNKSFYCLTEKDIINTKLRSQAKRESLTQRDQNMSAFEVSSKGDNDIKVESNMESQTAKTVVLRRQKQLGSQTSLQLDVVVESGNVKRWSRNFEVGIFNVSSDSDSETANVPSNESETNTEPLGIEITELKQGDETASGVVRRHTQAIESKYRESLKRDSIPVRKSSSSVSDDDPETGEENVKNKADSKFLGDSKNNINLETSTMLPFTEKTDQEKPSQEVSSTLQELQNVEELVREKTKEVNREHFSKEKISDGAESSELVFKTPEAGTVEKSSLVLEEGVKSVPVQYDVAQKKISVSEREIQPVEPSTQTLNTASSSLDGCLNVVADDDVRKQSTIDVNREHVMSERVSDLSFVDKKMAIEGDWAEKEGLVKRHTSIIDERVKFPCEDVSSEFDLATSEFQIPDTETRIERTWSGTKVVRKKSIELAVTVDKNIDKTNATIEPGHVKRHKLRLEGRSASLPETMNLQGTKDIYLEQNSEHSNSSTRSHPASDAIDTTSVVRVKRHTQVIEDVIREATERDFKKADDTKTAENTDNECKSSYMKQNPLEVIVISRSPEERERQPLQPLRESKSRQAVLDALEKTHQIMDTEEDDTHTKWAQANVRQRTQILEEIIREKMDATEAFEQLLAKAFENQSKQKGVSVRRHGSFPRSMKPFEKCLDPSFHVRKRSFSTETETTRDNSSLDLSCQRDKSQKESIQGSIHTLPRDWKVRQDEHEKESNLKREVKSKQFIIEELALEEISYSQSSENEKEKRTLIVTEKSSGQF